MTYGAFAPAESIAPGRGGTVTPTAAEDAFGALSAAAPEGWRVEVVEGAIHVTGPGDGGHAGIVSSVSGQVRGHRKGLGCYTGLGLHLPGTSPEGRGLPDLVIAPKGSFRNSLEFHGPGAVMLVCEVTSAVTAERDRGPKLRGYAAAGIPFYLLIDRERNQAVLHSLPAGKRYTRKVEVDISQPLSLPEPLGFDLDTSEF
ncbi:MULTISPECIES: Uma2 family endonuclease [Streptomyces violaceusniger group]|uniref:Uma2 family endonuclease n=1 Tax=Streptomyces violaceusniger group TaxID=2839105 RepID=UPI0027E5B6E1|nr:Uma2 family endonuclease [Streptomyces rhizosphaericus]